MPIETEAELQSRIKEATERLAIAQSELEAAMAELTVSTRADKRMVTERLRRAMSELVTARTSLAEIIEPY